MTTSTEGLRDQLPDEVKALLDANTFLKVTQFVSSSDPSSQKIKIHCDITGRDLPATEGALQEHLKSKKLIRQRDWYRHDYTQYEPYLVQHFQKEKCLYCNVTKQTLNKIPDEVEKHIKGKKYLRLKEDYEAMQSRRKERQEKAAAEEEESDDDSEPRFFLSEDEGEEGEEDEEGVESDEEVAEVESDDADEYYIKKGAFKGSQNLLTAGDDEGEDEDEDEDDDAEREPAEEEEEANDSGFEVVKGAASDDSGAEEEDSAAEKEVDSEDEVFVDRKATKTKKRRRNHPVKESVVPNGKAKKQKQRR